MKVAIVMAPGSRFDVVTPTSIETVARTLATHSRDRSDILILCDDGASDRGDLQTVAVPFDGDRGRRTARVIEAVRAFGPDLIECHQHGPTSARIARAFSNVPTTLYRHNLTVAPRHAIDRLRYHHRFAPFVGHVFVGQYLRDDFAAKYPAFEARAYAMPNPIDPALWRGDPEDKDPVIAFAGRAAPEKGLDLMCEALVPVLSRHRDWRAVLLLNDWHVHADWSQPHLDKLAPFGDRVTIGKSQPIAVVRETLRRAAIVAVPSVFQDPFPLAVLEAHAAGAAVVSSGRGGLAQASGGHALTVAPLSAEALAQSFGALVSDPERRLALAQAGQRYVVQHYNPTIRSSALDDLRHDLVSARTP